MKLVKLFNKLSAVALAASLVVGFASCSTTTDDPFNPNAPLTLEEYVKSEIKKAIENGGAQAEWHEQAEAATAHLIEIQDPTSITYVDDAGHTDDIAGVSINVDTFFELAEKALEGAR